MTFRFLRLAAALLPLATVGAARAQAPGQGAELNVISKVAVSTGERLSIDIVGTRKPNFTTFSMSEPERLVIDVAEARFQGVPVEQVAPGGAVASIKTAEYTSETSAIARVIITFTGEVEMEVKAVGETALSVRPVLEPPAGGEPPPSPGRPEETRVAQASPGGPEAGAPEAGKAEEKRPPADAVVAQAPEPAPEEARKRTEEEKRRTAEEERQRKLAEKQAAEEERQRKLAEKQAAEEARKRAEDEKRRLAEEERQRILAEKQAAEEARKQAEAEKRRLAEEERQRVLAEKKAAEERRRLAEEEQQRALAEEKAAEEERRREAEEERKQAEAQKRRLAEEERQRKLAEKRAAEEAQKRAAEEARKQAEAEKRRLAEEARERKLAEQQAAEQARKQAAEEKRLRAEAEREEKLAAERERRAAQQEQRRAAEEQRERRRLAQAQASAESDDGEEAEEAGGEGGEVETVGFRQTARGSRVFVRTTRPVGYAVKEAGPDLLVLELQGTGIGKKNNRRFLDTSFFDTPVSLVSPRVDGTSVRIEIKLKSQAPYQARQEGQDISVEFLRADGEQGTGGASEADEAP